MDNVMDHLNERCDIENNYSSVIARSRTLILEGEASSPRAMLSNTENDSKTQSIPRNVNEIQLPRIQLPTFSGTYEDWPGFADQFKATVHDNKQLTDSKQPTYLRSCLTGEAVKTIETLGTAASNYAIAWSILESRYDKPHIIINRHLDTLFGMPKGLKPSYDEFTKYLITAESHTIALKARGELTTDTILLYLLSTKMDAVTELKWREKTQAQCNLTLSDLFNFIQDQRCLVLPSGQNSRIYSKSSPPIKPKCNAKHHTLLQEDSRPSASTAQANVASLSAQTAANGLLSTAIVDVTDKFDRTHSCRALIDPGSQSHFLSKLLAQKLQLDRKEVNVPVQGIHSMRKLIPESVTIM
ncbi:PREDICTED: uncharacterized protein LOC108570073, partial [Habropoda laboriosa]|uniref:uncharacterized protein LOC108570073 n=1 Tax=Habropoda laboriosa TaxID=597456 RepID=UPI00083D35BF